MIKFFRKIRQKLLSENKFSKYLLYAIGEIVLVVIGILIALQINAWNQARLDKQSEGEFLMEIQENLNEDLEKINEIRAYNKRKLQAIDSAFHYMHLMHQNRRYGRPFSQQLPTITSSPYFIPTKVGFNNIISQGRIGILRSDELRKQISRYYSDIDLDGIQEQLKITSQQFLETVAPKMVNKELTIAMTKRDFDVIGVDELTFYKAPEILSGLFIMINKTIEYNQLLKAREDKVNALNDNISEYLNN